MLALFVVCDQSNSGNANACWFLLFRFIRIEVFHCPNIEWRLKEWAISLAAFFPEAISCFARQAYSIGRSLTSDQSSSLIKMELQ